MNGSAAVPPRHDPAAAAVRAQAATPQPVTRSVTPPFNEASAWAALAAVLDPEVPVLSVLELGIVRSIAVTGRGAHVVVTPTYSGCPATEVIQDAIRTALFGAGADAVNIELRFAPAWTTDWISPQAAEKLHRYGIAPPHATEQPLHFHARSVACPRCSSQQTERLSAFGSTACKSLYRCLACREPFEYFKPI